MSITSFKPVLLAAATAVSLLLSGCSAEKKASAPPKPGTLAHTWYSANETWKQGNYQKSMEYLSRLAVAQSEYRERATMWLVVASAGIADGYLELSNAYDEGSRLNKAVTSDYRNQMREVRNVANTAALQFAETMHEVMDKNKDLQFKFDFDFPSGEVTEPMQMAKVKKGLTMQAADHEVLRKGMAARGIVKFASMLAGAPGDPAKARAQFAAPPRDAALTAVAKNLIGVADLYCQRKLDVPKRGNALCNEALEAIAMLPESKERKELEAKAREELKRFKIAS